MDDLCLAFIEKKTEVQRTAKTSSTKLRLFRVCIMPRPIAAKGRRHRTSRRHGNLKWMMGVVLGSQVLLKKRGGSKRDVIYES